MIYPFKLFAIRVEFNPRILLAVGWQGGLVLVCCGLSLRVVRS